MTPSTRVIAPALAALAALGCRGKQDDRTGGEAAQVEDSAAGPAGEATMGKEYSFTLEQKAWMMKVAKESSAAAAAGRDYAPPAPDPSWTLLAQNGAAFVTLRRKNGGSLRGCIGHIVARIPLYECIAEMGRSATIHDTRFAPVTPSELPSIRYEISVLTPLEPVRDPEEIVVGTDGVVLSLGYSQGVFLPQVPVEQGWDRTTYLDELCYKAGVPRAGCWKDKAARLQKFQAIVWEEEDVE